MQFEKKQLNVSLGILVIVILAGIAFFAVPRSQKTAPAGQSNAARLGSQNGANGNSSDGSGKSQENLASADLNQTVTPIDTKVGSVAGVDLGGLASDANQSASVSAQDGSADASAIASDSQAVNSITDSINNQIQ